MIGSEDDEHICIYNMILISDIASALREQMLGWGLVFEDKCLKDRTIRSRINVRIQRLIKQLCCRVNNEIWIKKNRKNHR